MTNLTLVGAREGRVAWGAVVLMVATATVVTAGCTGSASDAPSDPPAEQPPIPPQVTVAVTGTVTELFDQVPVATANVEAAGISPTVEATADADGEFSISVQASSVIYMTSSKAGFAVTTSGPYRLGETPSAIAVSAINAATLTQIKTAAVPEGNLEHGVVVVDLLDGDGVPLAGIDISQANAVLKRDGAPMADLPRRLLDEDLVPLSENESLQTDASGRFLVFSVPAGSYSLSVEIGPNPDSPAVEVAVEVPASGAAVAVLRQAPPPVDVDSFAEDIYPLLQRTADGGLGCARCHSANSTASYRIHFDAPPADVCRWIVEGYTATEPNPLDPNDVLERGPLAHFVAGQEDQSRILYFPLYGRQFSAPTDPPAMLDTHPNATFVSTSDPGYLALKQWILNNVDYSGDELLQMACGIEPPAP